MAIDTEDRRRSVVGILPVTDGAVFGVDKQHVAGFYRGIAAVTPVPSCRIVRISSEDRTVTIPYEDRTMMIPYEDRTVVITCQ